MSFNLSLTLGLGRQGGASLDPATVAYLDAVTDGSQSGGAGVIIDLSAVDAVYRKIAKMNLTENIKHCVSSFAGVRLRVDGATSYVNKLYDLAATNHYTQGEATLQPILDATGIKFDGANDALVSDFGYNYTQPVTIISKLFTAAYPDGDIVATLKNTATLVGTDVDGDRTIIYGLCLNGGGTYGYFLVGSKVSVYSAKKTITANITALMSNKASVFAYVNSSPFLYANGESYATGNGGSLSEINNVTALGGTPSRAFLGSIQGFAVFNKVLSQAEIVAFSEVL